MNASDLKPGDVVHLELAGGDGPPMTVLAVQANGETACCWFDKNDCYHERAFHAAALKKAEPKPAPALKTGHAGKPQVEK